jgi:catechol 2,3-dioxygenase-like lactoylglutathione lyase family enzyme
MLDHVVLNVKNIEASRKFYEAALAPIGYKVTKAYPGFVGFGAAGKSDCWLAQRGPASAGVHLALACDSRSSVDAFHRAALKAGGKDNGAPGLRAIYHPDYYGAFVLDPDGNNIEAVCHAPQGK